MIKHIDQLRKLYLEDLSKTVTYGNNPPRPRVRHPSKWMKLKAHERLDEKYEEPKTLPLTDDDKNIWVWSDQHFFHKNIIEFSDRPFLNTREMNAHLIANFNDYVQSDDISIWVGDVGFKGVTFTNELLRQCNGYKILVVGNHDFDGKKVKNLNFDEIHLLYSISTPEVDLVLTHYPMFNVPAKWINIHGHLHAFPNPTTGHPQHYNINCELHDYKPVNLKEVIRVAKMRLISELM